MTVVTAHFSLISRIVFEKGTHFRFQSDPVRDSLVDLFSDLFGEVERSLATAQLMGKLASVENQSPVPMGRTNRYVPHRRRQDTNQAD